VSDKIQAFNNRVEYGLRALIVLQHAYPNSYDLSELSCLDYLIVHSGDFNSSLKSLHAPIPNRKQEIYIRRSLLDAGLKLFSQYNLVKPIFLADGIYYQITDEGEPFIDSLMEEYTTEVKSRADWAVSNFGGMPVNYLRQIIKESTGTSDLDIAFHMDGLTE